MRAIVRWEEEDAYSRWGRRYYCYLQGSKVIKRIKRRTHKRERREAKIEIRNHD